METWSHYSVLCLSAFGAGVLNSVAGGGTLLTFPALTAVIDPALANATSTVALLPGSFAGAAGYRRELWACRQFVAWMLAPSLLGGLIGAWLVDWDREAFAGLVPWLILTAAVLFAVQAPLGRWLRRQMTRRTDVAATPPRLRGIVLATIAFQFAVAVYGGYFGAGIGILMLSALGFLGVGDIHRMNAVKTFLAAMINTASVIIFIIADMVKWEYAVPMAVAAIAGGYFGAHTARRLPAELVRRIVIVLAFGLATYYFIRPYV